MLVLSRRKKETFVIDGRIEFEILREIMRYRPDGRFHFP